MQIDAASFSLKILRYIFTLHIIILSIYFIIFFCEELLKVAQVFVLAIPGYASRLQRAT